jgi:hypothetical protein
MKTFPPLALLAGLALIFSPACGGPKEPAANADASWNEADEEIASTPGIADARILLNEGQVDEAAARLAQMQLQGGSLNADQGREFRQAYSDVYDQAIEAMQRGDPRGEAALRLLRAAGPR